MPLVEVQRVSGGYTEHLNPFEVVIDDEVVGLLGPGESLTFELTAGFHEIFARIYWCRSEKMVVELGRGDELGIRCDTRANLLTDGYWATLGRRRYLRLERSPDQIEDRMPVGMKSQNEAVAPLRPRRSGLPLLLIGAAGFLSLALSQGLGFLASISLIFIAVQGIIALNFFLLAPTFGSVAGVRSHDPFRFRSLEEAVLSGVLAIAGILTFVGVIQEGDLAGWLAFAAAIVGIANVLSTRLLSRGR